MHTLLTSLLFFFSCSKIGASSYEFSESGSQSEDEKGNVDTIDFIPHFFRISEGWFPMSSNSISPEIQLQFFEANTYKKCSLSLTGSVGENSVNEPMYIQELSLKQSNCNKETDNLIKDKLIFSFLISELTDTQRNILIDSFHKSETSTFSSFEDRIYGGSCALFSVEDSPLFTDSCYFLGHSYTAGEISDSPLRNTQSPDVIRILGLMSQDMSKLP